MCRGVRGPFGLAGDVGSDGQQDVRGCQGALGPAGG